MKLLLDNNLPPALAHALHELSQKGLDRPSIVVALRDRFAADAPDEEWINALAGEGGWVIVTHDRFNKGLEREAIRRSGLKVFLLDSSWDHQSFWEKAHCLVRWWPRIVEQAEGIADSAMFRVPWKFSGKGQFKQLQI